MPAPAWLARFNSYVTNPVLSPLARRVSGMGIVVHTGRKSHRQYRTPVMVFRRGDRFIIALTYGRYAQWVLNVTDNGGCELETEGQTLRLSNPRIFHDVHRRAMPVFVRVVLGILNVSDFLELSVAH
jgi:deazaflavin-dependent oxidoreductase (nitroreductase family)